MKRPNSRTHINSLSSRDIDLDSDDIKLVPIIEFENGVKIQKWCIGKYKYSVNDLLGSGYSSNVYKAVCIDNPKQKFALKVIDLNQFKDSMQMLETQISILKDLNHPNIIKCIDVYKAKKYYYLVTQYCPHGDLQQLIKLQKQVAEDRAIIIMTQVIDACKYLLNNGIIHRDLKPANIMRFGNKWKIGDFGFARNCQQEFVLDKIHLGTPLYMALQCLQNNKYSKKSDIFSIGIIFYELLYGSTPWQCNNQRQLIVAMKNNPQPQLSFVISPEISEFIRKATCLDYYGRMTKQEFKKVDFSSIDLSKLIQLRTKSPTFRAASYKSAMSKSLKKQGLQTPLKLQGLNQLKSSPTIRNVLTPRAPIKISDIMTNLGDRSPIRLQRQRNTLKTNQYYLSKREEEVQEQIYQDSQNSKAFQKNTQKIRNQIEFCKIIINMIQNIHYFLLDKRERTYIITLLYSFVTKNLKMVGTLNLKINILRLDNWDTFKKSGLYSKSLLDVLEYYEQYNTWFKEYLKGVEEPTFKKIKSSFPDLFAEGYLNFRFYALFFIEIKQFVSLYILDPNKQIQADDRSAFGNGISQLIQIVEIIKYRSFRQNQIKGIGLQQKPKNISNYSMVSSQSSSEKGKKFEEKLNELRAVIGRFQIVDYTEL